MQSPVFKNAALQTAFDTDGIVHIPFLSEVEIETLISIYEETSQNVGDRKFHSTMFIDDPDYRKRTDVALRTVIYPKAEPILNKYRLLFANFIVKEPSIKTNVDIHQDWNVTLPEYTSVNIWIPLTDIDEQTGIFYALKGSHRSFRNIRYTPYPSNQYKPIEKFILQNSSSYRVKAGDAIIYHGALVHFSDANISMNKRLAIGSVFIPEDVPSIHYYRRSHNDRTLELYETDEAFYNRFNFMEEPTGVKKISEINDYYELPSEQELISGEFLIKDML